MDSVDVYNMTGYANNMMGSRTSGDFTKRCSEDDDGRSSTMEECDSTTGPACQKAQFAVGDDVFYQEETGQNVLGTVALVQGKKVKIIFMDETEKWAHISRVKKLIDDEEESKQNGACVNNSADFQSNDGGVSSASKRKSKGDINGQGAPRESMPVTCGSCGTQKMITSKKASEYSPFTPHQYNCRKCINKSKTNKNNGVPLPLSAHYLAARGRPKGPPGSDMGGAPLVKGLMDQGNGMYSRQENCICLHCRTQIVEKMYLQCTMCERPCHPSCLALTPPPLPGDMFWSIICHMCGTQKSGVFLENDTQAQKLYSSRRNISSWSDVAYLVLSCLGCKFPTERFFHLDEQVIPFWEENLSRLHLPRQYKNSSQTDRRRNLLQALVNANLRFVHDDEKKGLWAIKDHAYKGLNIMIKPPVVSGGRAVTAAGFPISVRTNNPEAASAAMTSIAQTIAANKANNVPTPKNSPSAVIPKSNSVTKTVVGAVGTNLVMGGLPGGRKIMKPFDAPPVAKKTGSELNLGMQQRPKSTDMWQQQSMYPKNVFLDEFSKPPPNIVNAGQEGLSATSDMNISGSRAQSATQSVYKQGLSASPGGAARVTGMIHSSSSSPGGSAEATTHKASCGSYPVRKNGSPMLNRSIRVEPVDKKREVGAHQQVMNPYSFQIDGSRKMEQELIRESPGFNNAGISLKRKLSSSKSADGSSGARSLDGQSSMNEAKKLKMNLPNSTDVTSQRVPSPTRPPSSESPTRGSKKDISPLQKLSDLQKNGGLTVACLTHTESGVQTVVINELEEVRVITSRESMDIIKLEKYDALQTTPVKNGATAAARGDIGGTPVITLSETEDEQTKEKSSNVTTSPRAFKLASVSSPGTSTKTSPISDRRRPVRLKRTVVANTQSEKQSKLSSNDSAEKAAKKVKGNNATAAALVAKASRGRPKKPFKLLRKPIGMTFNIGQFNGIVKSSTNEDNSPQKINELDYTWSSSTVGDLIEYGQGYRLECLPKCPENKQDLADQAVQYFKEEVTPRPPSYWTSSNQSKKPSNQKSRRDLKNVDSYYISGRSIGANGIQYQVVWRDGYGFEYTSEDEEELGVGLGDDNYLCFEDYDAAEYFFDKMPVTVNSLTGNCDNNSTGSDSSSDRIIAEEDTRCFASTSNTSNMTLCGVKREPIELSTPENSPAKVSTTPAEVRTTRASSISEPVIIDLTDSP